MERGNERREQQGDRVKVLFTYLYVLIYMDERVRMSLTRIIERRLKTDWQRRNRTHANTTRDAKSEIAIARVDRRKEKRQPKAPVGDKFTALGHKRWLSNRYCALETRNDTEKIGERRPGHASVASVFGRCPFLAATRCSLLATRYSLLAATRPREPRCCPLLHAVLSSFPLCFSQRSVTPSSAYVALHRLALSDRWLVRSFVHSLARSIDRYTKHNRLISNNRVASKNNFTLSFPCFLSLSLSLSFSFTRRNVSRWKHF